VATFQIEVIVTPRPDTHDPQAEVMTDVLRSLELPDLRVISVGRMLRLAASADTEHRAVEEVRRLCTDLLINPHLETFELRIAGTDSAASTVSMPSIDPG
jgi:phosphoribosylformylglycinamidine synthase